MTYGKNSLGDQGPLWSKLDKKVRNWEFNMLKTKVRKVDLVGMMEGNCKNCILCSS